MINEAMFGHSFILLGDCNTGKTTTLRHILSDNFAAAQVISSTFSLYNWQLSLDETITVGEESVDKIYCTFWDVLGSVTNIGYFCFLGHVSTALIFCNLQNVTTCHRLEFWKNLIEKYQPDVQLVIVATTQKYTPENIEPTDEEFKTVEEKESEREEFVKAVEKNRQIAEKIITKNRVSVLEWCVENGDLPFFEIQLDDPITIHKMYQTIITHGRATCIRARNTDAPRVSAPEV